MKKYALFLLLALLPGCKALSRGEIGFIGAVSGNAGDNRDGYVTYSAPLGGGEEQEDKVPAVVVVELKELKEELGEVWNHHHDLDDKLERLSYQPSLTPIMARLSKLEEAREKEGSNDLELLYQALLVIGGASGLFGAQKVAPAVKRRLGTGNGEEPGR